MKWTKRTIAGALAGGVLAGGAAFAAVSLWGTGDAAVAATQSQGLAVDNVRLVNPLVPGGTSSALADVYNPNSFPAKVTGMVVLTEGQSVTTCSAASQNSVHLAAGSATTAQVDAAGTTKPGVLFPVVADVTIPAQQKRTVQVNNVVSQDTAATEFCGFTAKLAVKAETAGN